MLPVFNDEMSNFFDTGIFRSKLNAMGLDKIIVHLKRKSNDHGMI